jgi:hypothetical protein
MVACVTVRVMATVPKNYTGRIFLCKTQSLVLSLLENIVTTKLRRNDVCYEHHVSTR